ncbi:MAG: hypothetical protein AAGA03_11130 [Planctomycetota bacterium]
MPATFDDFGLRFLYPDNWTLAEREEDEGRGATLNLPGGGFLSIEANESQYSDQQLVEAIAATFAEDYEDVEREPVTLPEANEDEVSFEFRFYYLDLLVQSRVILIDLADERWMIQIQAESREFDENELVFAAVLKQLRAS